MLSTIHILWESQYIALLIDIVVSPFDIIDLQVLNLHVIL